MKSKIVGFFAAFFTVLAFSTSGLAQETKTTQNTQQSTERGAQERFGKMGKMRGGHHGGAHHSKMLRVISELNLTDSQKQQVNSIVEINKTATAANREEFKQLIMQRRDSSAVLTPEQDTRLRELGSQLRAAGKKMSDDLIAVLTPEQQAQLEQKRAAMRARRQEFRRMKQSNGEPATTPNN